MEITNCGVNGASVAPHTPVEPTADCSAAPGSSAVSTGSAYVPSPELTRLLQQVRAEPEVRSDRVQAARERVRQGHYHSQASIEQTAQAMLNDNSPTANSNQSA